MDRTECYKSALSALRQALEAEQIIIYGAHLVAQNAYSWLKMRKKDLNVISFAVTDMEGNPRQIDGIPVNCIADLRNEASNCYILAALPEIYHEAVTETLLKNKFHNYGMAGLKGMSDVIGEDIIEYIIKSRLPLRAAKDMYDPTCLNLFLTADIEQSLDGDIYALRHYKLPVISKVPVHMAPKRFFETFDFIQSYHKVCGSYLNCKNLPDPGPMRGCFGSELLRLYMVTGPKDVELRSQQRNEEWLIPLKAGSVLCKEREQKCCYDDQGDNISAKNSDFCEMTAMYWIWKNSPHSKYKGLCHYRRHFCLDIQQVYAAENCGIDAIMTVPRLVTTTIRDYFRETPVSSDVFEAMMRALQVLHKDYFVFAERYFQQSFYYPNNMVIAREQVFDDYCTWVFPVLFLMETMCRSLKKKSRYIAYSAELLTSLYFAFNKNNLKIAVSDYKLLD